MCMKESSRRQAKMATPKEKWRRTIACALSILSGLGCWCETSNAQLLQTYNDKDVSSKSVVAIMPDARGEESARGNPNCLRILIQRSRETSLLCASQPFLCLSTFAFSPWYLKNETLQHQCIIPSEKSRNKCRYNSYSASWLYKIAILLCMYTYFYPSIYLCLTIHPFMYHNSTNIPRSYHGK